MSNSKETMTKKQQDDLASTFNNLPWSLPLGFPSMPSFGAFPPFGLPTPNFPSLNSLVPSTAAAFPPSTSSLSSTDPTTADLWSNGLSTTTSNMDYNEYVKQFGLLMNAFKEQPKQSGNDESKTSSTTKTSKSKRTTSITHTPPLSSSDSSNGKSSRPTVLDESHPRPTSTSSSSTSSQRSSSKTNPIKSSTSSSSTRSKPMQTSTSTKTSTTIPDATTFDPLAFATATTAGLPFSYFLPSSTSTTSYPFSSLPSSLINPAASLYPFLSPDWFTSPSKFIDGFGNLPSTKSTDSKESTPHQSKSKQSQKPITTSENKHLPSLNSLLNESSSSSKSKKRAKSIRALTEEQEEKNALNNQARKSSTITNSSLLHSALTKTSADVFRSLIDTTSIIVDSETNNGNGLREHLLNLSQPSSIADAPLIQSADESRSNDDDDSDPNPKRRKTEEVNEALVGIPLARGWKRVTIVRAITRTGVRGDVSYYAPCGRKLRSFQEIDRYLSKKNITDLDRSHFTFSSKVHLGLFHEPKEGPDGKTIFQESTEEEIINRIMQINPKFRPVKYDHESETSAKTSAVSSPSMTPSHNNGTNDHHHQSQDLLQHLYDESRKLRLEHEEMTKRSTEKKTKREAKSSSRSITGESSKTSDRLPNPTFSHDFLQAILEQQKQEFEHQQKLQQEQQEQERKRQELAYLKQLEMKKRQEEKLLFIEQRKAEKNAEREKKIQEKYMEIVLAKETKRVVEDMQLRDLKPLPTLKPVENSRLSIEAFANALTIIQFLTNFKQILQIPDHLIPSLNTFQQSSSRDLNTLCQMLLNIALDDPGIPNPKKGLTNLGQKLSEIEITEHTFSEILRLYIRERNGFDDKLTQTLSDTSFQSLSIDEKSEILAFLCNDLSANKRIVEEVDRNIDELTMLKHEKLEVEKRLRRLKFEKSSNAKKMITLVRDKDLNSSDNESPDESDAESAKNDEETTIPQDSATVNTDDQDIENIDETKIDDLDKRFTLVTRKYTLSKRRVIEKHSRTRVLHLGQDRYRRRYWYFSHLPGIYVEGLTSGDISLDDIKDTVENAAKQKLDKTGDVPSLPSRSTQRRKQQTKTTNPTTPPPSTPSIEPSNPVENNKINHENDEESASTQPEVHSANNLATMDLSAFCTSVEAEPMTIKTEPSEESNHQTNKRELNESNDDDLPLDLSCAKVKRSCEEEYWTSQPTKSSCSFPERKFDQFQELNDLATTAMFLNDIKQENILGLTSAHFTSSIKQEPSMDHYKQIERSIRQKFQYPEPLSIPEDMQSGWWSIQTPDELRSLIKSLAKRGERERYLCRMLQRYFELLTHSMKFHSQSNLKTETPPPSTETQTDNDHDEHPSINSNGLIDHESTNFDDTHQMDVLNEIYNLSDRIIFSSLHCRSYDTNTSRVRLTYTDIQAKGSDILDEAKHLLTEIERNIERRYLKHPFVRKYEMNIPSLNRLNHHTSEESTNEPNSSPSSSRSDEVPQQLERWRRAIYESRTPAQLALCLTQLERCIAWERSITRVFCEICNSDDDEEKLLLCDGCDHGTHTFCLRPPMSSIPSNDWFCYVCIGKAKGENLCFICGNKNEYQFHRCEHCGKYFHEDCLKNAKQQRGKWFCVLCAANDPSVVNNGNSTTKSSTGRQTSRSMNSRQPSTNSIASNTNGDSTSPSKNRSRSNNNRKSKSTNEPPQIQESHSNSSHADTSTLNDSLPMETNDIESDQISPIAKKSSKKSKVNNDVKSCRIILNELLKSDVSWPFQTPVDAKEHPEYYECVNHPMDFSTIKKKMRNNRYTKREEFLQDVELILNNCEYFNEDDSPVGQAGHLLRTFFQSQWTKQFG